MVAVASRNRPLATDLLSRMVLQAEEAHARIERAAGAGAEPRAAGAMVHRRLQGARPIIGALRLKRLRLVLDRWRGTEPLRLPPRAA